MKEGRDFPCTARHATWRTGDAIPQESGGSDEAVNARDEHRAPMRMRNTEVQRVRKRWIPLFRHGFWNCTSRLQRFVAAQPALGWGEAEGG